MALIVVQKNSYDRCFYDKCTYYRCFSNPVPLHESDCCLNEGDKERVGVQDGGGVLGMELRADVPRMTVKLDYLNQA